MPKVTRKCHTCGLDDTHYSEMELVLVGTKPIKKYYHKGECYQAYLDDEAFREKERMEKDKLNEVIKEIYGVKEVPTQAWTFLTKLREGNQVFSNRKDLTKRQKEGYEWDLIRKTFEYCSDTIEYHNATKDFGGFVGAFKYALMIVIDKIYIVEQREKDRKKQQMMIDKKLAKVDAEEQEFQSSYKKPSKSNTDISDFLDD